jgi:hypothetical protein
MATKPEPVVLELAPLPREQIGPFLLLGVDKDAGSETIEANWAQRVIWARKNLIQTSLGDINWAREVISDADRRLKADLTSLNLDLARALLRRLEDQYAPAGQNGPGWQPADGEKMLEDYVPATEIPDPREVQAAIVVPQVPEETPAVADLLRQLVEEPLDPWVLAPVTESQRDSTV